MRNFNFNLEIILYWRLETLEEYWEGTWPFVKSLVSKILWKGKRKDKMINFVYIYSWTVNYSDVSWTPDITVYKVKLDLKYFGSNLTKTKQK